MLDERIRDESMLIEKIEKAAKKGAKSGVRLSNILSTVIILIIAAAVVFAAIKLKPSQEPEEVVPIEDHDMTLDNDGVQVHYTVADFAEAILGDAKQQKKLEVYTAEISDVVTITDSGFANMKIFTKCQLLTYHGEATYTVDLSNVKERDIMLDEENKTIKLYIPHVERNTINIPSDKIEFGDTEKGVLAFGDIKLTAEQVSMVETEARSKMESRLAEDKVEETAERFATMSVWEIYQPLVSSVSPEYKLEIVFQ